MGGDRASLELLDEQLSTVGAAMTVNVLELAPTLLASEAVRILTEAGIAGAPVVEDGRVVGIITLRDLLDREGHGAAQVMTGPFLRADRQLGPLRVADVMTRDVFTAREDWPLSRAILLMDDAGVNRLPVVDREDRPIGILARDDVLRAVAMALREMAAARAERASRPDWTVLEAD
ncbi:MAG: HPP family protein [Candidatus Velamenicoccus archaeovorus]